MSLRGIEPLHAITFAIASCYIITFMTLESRMRLSLAISLRTAFNYELTASEPGVVMDIDRSQKSLWCHQCSSRTTLYIVLGDDEPNESRCSRCQSDFVEEIEGSIDEFGDGGEGLRSSEQLSSSLSPPYGLAAHGYGFGGSSSSQLSGSMESERRSSPDEGPRAVAAAAASPHERIDFRSLDRHAASSFNASLLDGLFSDFEDGEAGLDRFLLEMSDELSLLEMASQQLQEARVRRIRQPERSSSLHEGGANAAPRGLRQTNLVRDSRLSSCCPLLFGYRISCYPTVPPATPPFCVAETRR